ncbi:MAG: alpha-galactosidase, partial [Bacteroidaceae bacterium]|nr:alpha-galactosidase [Bacteroidaceae bacterium]
RFETPEAVLAFSSEGFNGLSRCMHDFVNRHIIPKAWQFKERPVLYNSWEGCGFDFDEARLLSLAGQAKALGCELFVLDDGWFGKRCSDTAGLGDYNVNLERLPSGLKGLSDKLRSLGLDFGLWFEPESVNPNSDLYRSHPDWIQQDRLPPLLGRHQLLLDLGKPEVRDYIVENVSTILDEADVRYVKWDMNRYSTLLGARTHLHILGLYDVLRRIFGPRPHVLLESCSSGGNRFDLGMLCFSPQIWASDNTDPIERIDIQEGLSLLYPQSAMGAHVSAAPHCQTMRVTPLSTRAHVSFFGILGYEFDLNHLTDTQRNEIRKQIGFYKENRRLFQFGSFHRMKTEYGTGWQVSLEDQHIVGLFHRLIPASPGYESISLQGLDLHKKYRAAFALREETNSILCSGAALKAGWILPPLFCGTGNLAESRNHADFGSDLLKIEGL